MSKKNIRVLWNNGDVGTMSIREALDYAEESLPLLHKGETIEFEVLAPPKKE